MQTRLKRKRTLEMADPSHEFLSGRQSAFISYNESRSFEAAFKLVLAWFFRETFKLLEGHPAQRSHTLCPSGDTGNTNPSSTLIGMQRNRYLSWPGCGDLWLGLKSLTHNNFTLACEEPSERMLTWQSPV